MKAYICLPYSSTLRSSSALAVLKSFSFFWVERVNFPISLDCLSLNSYSFSFSPVSSEIWFNWEAHVTSNEVQLSFSSDYFLIKTGPLLGIILKIRDILGQSFYLFLFLVLKNYKFLVYLRSFRSFYLLVLWSSTSKAFSCNWDLIDSLSRVS